MYTEEGSWKDAVAGKNRKKNSLMCYSNYTISFVVGPNYIRNLQHKLHHISREFDIANYTSLVKQRVQTLWPCPVLLMV